jgi:2'-deoxynucleoside 5'-phosphate N-hydrolase
MKVYFAASITGGRDNQEIYPEIVNFLKENNCKVLTEHISDKNLSSYGETNLLPEEIFQRDLDWIRESDILIAEVSQVSLGVGYEIGFAESIGKKIICLYKEKEGKKLSAMIEGNKNLIIIKYKTFQKIKQKLKKIIFEKI